MSRAVFSTPLASHSWPALRVERRNEKDFCIYIRMSRAQASLPRIIGACGSFRSETFPALVSLVRRGCRRVARLGRSVQRRTVPINKERGAASIRRLRVFEQTTPALRACPSLLRSIISRPRSAQKQQESRRTFPRSKQSTYAPTFLRGECRLNSSLGNSSF